MSKLLPEPRQYGQRTSGDDFMRPFYWAEEVEAALAAAEAALAWANDEYDIPHRMKPDEAEAKLARVADGFGTLAAKLAAAEAMVERLERCLQILVSSLFPMATAGQNAKRIAAVKRTERGDA